MQPGETPAVPGPQPLDEQTLQRLQDDLPGDELLYDLAELFRVFADSTRVKILYALFESELCVGDIAQLLNLSGNAIPAKEFVGPSVSSCRVCNAIDLIAAVRAGMGQIFLCELIFVNDVGFFNSA